MTAKYRAFISYSHADTRWGEWLHKSLEGYKVPSSYVGLKNDAGERIEARLGKVFRDRDELTSGHDLAEAIREALEMSENFVVICSPSAAKSRYVNQEIIEFKRLGRGDRLHAVIVGGEPHASTSADRADQECLPPALRFTLDEQGRLTDRPGPELLAPDFRRGRDEKNRALIKLIAGLLRVDFDTLYQRERRRRRRRMAALGAVTTGVVVTVAALGWTAFERSREARRQQGISAHEAYATALELAETSRRAGEHDKAVVQLQGQKPSGPETDPREFAWRYLWRVYDGHRHAAFVSGQTTGIDLSPDGKRMAIANGSSLVTLWDVGTGAMVGRIEDPDEGFRTATFLAGGTGIATEGEDGRMRIWNAGRLGEPGRVVGEYLRPTVLRDRKTLMTRGPRGLMEEIRFVDVATMSEKSLGSARGLGALTCYAMSPDGRAVALGTSRNTILVVDPGTGRTTHRREFPNDWRLSDVEFTPDSALLVVGIAKSKAYEILVWEPASRGEDVRLRGPDSDAGLHTAVAASRKGDLVALLTGDSKVMPKQQSRLTVWDRRTGQVQYALDEEQTGFVTAMQFSPTADLIATGSRDHHIRLWDASAGVVRNVLGIHHGSITREVEERSFHREAGTVVDERSTEGAGISMLSFSPDGHTLVTASGEYGAVRIWNATAEPEVRELPARADHVTAVAFSPDRRSVVTGDRAGVVAAWNAATGAKLAQVAGHSGPVLGLAFSSSGDTVASASVDGGVRLWRASGLSEVRTFAGAPGATHALVMGGNRLTHLSRRLGFEGMAAEERPADFELRSWTRPGPGKPFSVMVRADLVLLSPDGTRLVAIGGDEGRSAMCSLRVWEIATGRSEQLRLARKPCGGLTITRAAWSPDGKLLAIGGPAVAFSANQPHGTQSGIRIFDVVSRRERGTLPLPLNYLHSGELKGLAFSPDGTLLAALSPRPAADGKTALFTEHPVVTLWDVATLAKKDVLEVRDPICGRGNGVACVRFGGFSPDGQALGLIISRPPPQAGNSQVTVWRFGKRGSEQFATDARIDAVVFSPGDRLATLITSRNGAPAILWDRATGRHVAALGGYEPQISAVRQSPEGHPLVETLEYPTTGGATAKVWNLQTGALIVSRTDSQARGVRFVDVSPAGRLLAEVRGDGSVAVSEIAGKRALASLGADSGASRGRPDPFVLLPRPLVAFSPDESLLAAVGKSETIVWEVASARAVRTLPGTAPIAFSSGGSALATTVECDATTVWELRSGRPTLRAPSPAGCPNSVALSPDGTTLAVIWSGFAGLGRAMDARLWNVRTGQGYASLRGYVDDGTPVGAFSPDGKTLATGGAGGTVNIWDPATGRRLLVLAGSTLAASSLHFSPDGATLIAGHGTNVRVWRAATEGR